MAVVHPPRPEFESPSAHFAEISRWCHSCGIEMEVGQQNEGLCNFCGNGSNGIRTRDLSDESVETLSLRRALGVLRFTGHTQEEEEEENGGVVNYFDCLGNNAEDFWIEEKEEEEIEQFEETEDGENAMPWEDVVISNEFHEDFDVRHRAENHSQRQNLWAEVDPGEFGRAVEARVSVEEEEDEDEVVFEFPTLRDYAEDYEVDLFKRGSNSEPDEFGLFRRSSILGMGFGSPTPGRGEEEEEEEEEDYPEVREQNMNSNSNPSLNSNPNPRGHDSFDPFEWNSVAEDESCNSSSSDDDFPSSITDSEIEDLCIACTSWDSFGLEENNEDNHEEWEELYGDEDAVVFSRPIAVEENQQDSNFPEEVEQTGNFGWTSVLEDFRGIEFTYEEDDADNDVDVDLDVDVDTYFGDPEDYADEAGYEVLLEQFAEVNNFPRGAPPTSKVVLHSLPSVLIKQEEIDNGNAWCPICKEVLNMGEPVKLLPCSHHYHGECILPWLRCRNSCPVCRFELPTDDPEYEMQRKQVIRQT